MAIHHLPASSPSSFDRGDGKNKLKKRHGRLRLVPQLPFAEISLFEVPARTVRSITAVEREHKSFFIICASIAITGLLSMFTLNIALTEGAFKVKTLKLQVIEINELRQAAVTEVSQISSPERLADSAHRLGMIPSTTPHFLSLESGQ
jgi:cell division protein FtsL